MRWLPRSAARRIALVAFLAYATAMLLFGMAVYWAAHAAFARQIDSSIEQATTALLAEYRDGEQGSGEDRRLLDRPGFAQEFLRRNPHYRSDYQKVMRLRRGGTQEQEVMARRWGLCFPLRARRVRRR